MTFRRYKKKTPHIKNIRIIILIVAVFAAILLRFFPIANDAPEIEETAEF